MATAEQPKRAADRIRETARDLFYGKGIRAVGVDEIVTQAGVTKPSLYRAYASKDDLAADFVAAWGEGFMRRFEATLAEHPYDARAGILAFFKRLGERAGAKGYRGCAVSNCVVEFPEKTHPGRAAALKHKAEVRERFRELARQMGARKPDQLGDALMLLLEGCFLSGQAFGEDGPARAAKKAASALIDAYTAPKD
jgi:AcrR family transcriptional regulator